MPGKAAQGPCGSRQSARVSQGWAHPPLEGFAQAFSPDWTPLMCLEAALIVVPRKALDLGFWSYLWD